MAAASPSISFRAMRRADLPALASWVAAPHVARRGFGSSDVADLEATSGPFIDGSDTSTEYFIIEADGHAVGFRDPSSVISRR